MTEDELERWTKLVVAEAHGRTLSASARATRRRIEREQPELITEASLWAEFAELEQPRPGERSDAAMIAEVLELERPSAEPQTESRPARTLGVVLALAALAACVALGLALGRLGSGSGHEAQQRGPARTLGGAAMAVDGPPELGLATPGEHHLGEDDCRRAGASARLCTPAQARFRVAEGSSDAQVELELDDGHLQVDTTTQGTVVVVHTEAGTVRARGLVMLRYDARTGALEIEIIRGHAELLRSGADHTNAAPVHLGAGVMLSLLAEGRESTAALPLEPAPAPAPEPSEPIQHTKPSPSKSAPPSADELLAAAQRALAAGDSATAIERYSELVREHPSTDAARTASVSLGRLLLRAGRAEQALAAFDRYLDSGAKGLLEEARYGRIRALRELGLASEADAAIAEFLAAHPGSIHRERLEAWRTQ